VYTAALYALVLHIRERWSAEAAERVVFNDERCFYGGGVRICSLKDLRALDAGFKERHRRDLLRWLTDVFLLTPAEAEMALSIDNGKSRLLGRGCGSSKFLGGRGHGVCEEGCCCGGGEPAA